MRTQDFNGVTITWPDPVDIHTERRIEKVARTILYALQDANVAGLVVEVTLEPDKPLSQGNYTPHIQIRERKDLGMKREADRMVAQHFPALAEIVPREPLVGKLLPPEGL